jgi:hypothetical protein
MTLQHRETDASWHIWKAPSLAWLALMALFLVSLTWAYRPIVSGLFAVNLVIAALMVALLVAFLMDLRNAKALIIIVATAGLFWTMFMFVLTFTDYLSRHS